MFEWFLRLVIVGRVQYGSRLDDVHGFSHVHVWHVGQSHDGGAAESLGASTPYGV
jgi:hypothetical protein